MFRTMLAVMMLMGAFGIAGADNYVGVGIGQLRIDDDSFDADDFGGKMFGGWRFSENVALELAYIGGGSPESRGVEVEPRAMQVAVLGALPLTDAFSVYARAGLLSWKTDVTFANDATIKADGEDFSWGLGTSLNISSRTSIRLEYEGADLDGTDMSFISLSGVIRYGAN